MKKIQTSEDNNNTLIISLGDPGGIGTEITLKALGSRYLNKNIKPLLVGCKNHIFKTHLKLINHGIKNIVVTGGVSANKRLRDKFSQVSKCDVFFPDVKFSTDNGAMIAYAGFLKSRSSDIEENFKIKPNPSLTL